MDPSRCLRVALLLLAALLPPATVAARTVDSPGEARLVTTDLARFWRVWEAHDGRPGADALQAGYLDPGTPGLQAFLALRIGSARQLAETIAAHPGYYASLRGVGEGVEDQRAAFHAAFEALEDAGLATAWVEMQSLVAWRQDHGHWAARRGAQHQSRHAAANPCHSCQKPALVRQNQPCVRSRPRHPGWQRRGSALV